MSRPSRGSESPTHDAMFEQASQWLTANVRDRRERAGLTQEQLAERAGVAPTYVARIEAAAETANVTLRVVGALAVALSCLPHELLLPRTAPQLRRVGRPKKASQV